MNRDLTVGNPGKVLLRFCLPLLCSVLFQQLYNIADSLIAGKFISMNALAAVGNAYEVTLIYLAFAFGCNIGCSVVTAKYFGAKQYSKMKTAISTTFIASIALAIFLMLIGYLFMPQLLNIIKTPAEIYNDSHNYINIYTIGLIFTYVYNIAMGIFSAMGDTWTPLIFLAISSVANIFIDYIFAITLNLGVPGLAWATILCQFLSSVFVLIALSKRMKQFKHVEEKKIFSFEVLKEVLLIAIPSAFQHCCVSIGNIIIQGLINSFGTSVIAGYSASIKLNNMQVSILSTMSNGVSNYVSQNLGANKPERISKGVKSGIIIMYAINIPIVLLHMIMGVPLMKLFMDNPTAEALHSGIMFLRIVSPFYFIISLKMIADGVLRSAHAVFFFTISTFVDLSMRVVLAFVFSDIYGAIGIWWAWPVGWFISTLLSIGFYIYVYKKRYNIDKIQAALHKQ